MTLQQAVKMMGEDRYLVIRRDSWDPGDIGYVFLSDDNILIDGDLDEAYSVSTDCLLNNDWSLYYVVYKPNGESFNGDYKYKLIPQYYEKSIDNEHINSGSVEYV